MEILEAIIAVWAARWPILDGIGNTLLISGVAIALGTMLGLGVRKPWRAALRAYLLRFFARHSGFCSNIGMLLHFVRDRD